MRNDLELMYRFAKKHKITCHFCENFNGGWYSFFMIDDKTDSTFDYYKYEEDDKPIIHIRGLEWFGSVEDALIEYENWLILKGE